jgi:hypothetical protein
MQNRFKVLALLAIFLLVGGGYWLFLRGWVDPRPVGEITAVVVPGEQVFTDRTADMRWQTLPAQPSEVFTIQLTSRFVAGERDSAYGLAIGEETMPLIVWVTPTGYAGVSQGEHWLMPLAPWPHVRTAVTNEPNEIWLTRSANGNLTVHVNRELLWQGKTVVLKREKIGVAGQLFAQNPTSATIVFDELLLWLESESR